MICMKTETPNLSKNRYPKILQACVFALLSIGWMTFIFLSSSADGDTSSMSSDAVYYHFLNWMPYSLEVIRLIRKSAHFIAYAVLGFLYAGFFDALLRSYNKVFFVSLVLGVFYAVTDEHHQFFVPGRSPMVTDIAIDACGIAVGIALAWAVKMLVTYCYQKIRSK